MCLGAGQVGRLWTSLADYFIRQGLFEKARDVYEEGIDTVRFSLSAALFLPKVHYTEVVIGLVPSHIFLRCHNIMFRSDPAVLLTQLLGFVGDTGRTVLDCCSSQKSKFQRIDRWTNQYVSSINTSIDRWFDPSIRQRILYQSSCRSLSHVDRASYNRYSLTTSSNQTLSSWFASAGGDCA